MPSLSFTETECPQEWNFPLYKRPAGFCDLKALSRYTKEIRGGLYRSEKFQDY
jgi:hypothetical protein